MKFKYLQLNIWFGGKFFDKVLDFLREQNADIVSLQEVYNGEDESLERNYRSVEIFKTELGYPFFHFAPSFKDTTPFGLIDIGNMILSKFPIKKTEVTFYDKLYGVEDITDIPSRPFFPRNLQYAVIDMEGSEVNIFCTHGVWGFDDRDNELRLKMSQVITDKVKGLSHVVLSGDFNVDQNTRSVANIEKELVNVFKGELKTSFNTRIKKDVGFDKSVVDMMFVSPDIKVLDHECFDIDVSDHLPLVATMAIK